MIFAQESKREHHLEIHSPVRRLRVEWTAGKRVRLAEQRRAQVPDWRAGIYKVEQIARVRAECHAVALAGLAADAEGPTTAATWTASGMSASTVLTGMRSSRLGALLIACGIQLGTDANRLGQAQIE